MATETDFGVKDAYKGKNVFMTGGSGFIGKALIEKLLRSIPDIGNIYIFMRLKRGTSPQERLKKIFNDKLFDTLKKTHPDSLNKVIAVEGDILQPKLGLSEQDRNIIAENVHIIFHSAASVRFDDPLKYAILVNVRFTRDLIKLAEEAKHLKAIVYVSTAFCNADKKIVEEELYPALSDWREAIKIAEESDQILTEILTAKCIFPLHNTYMYTKSLAEHVVNDLCQGKIPTVIVRPTIVVNAYLEPLPGWTDNLNGPVGLFYLASLGFLKIFHGSPDTILDVVPVDVVVNVLIVSAFDLIKNQNTEEVRVYNNSSHKYFTGSLGKQLELGCVFTVWQAPSNDMVWFPRFQLTKCKFYFFIMVILTHVIPALIIDGILRMMKMKPRLYKVHKKVFVANLVMAPFMLSNWTFKNDKAMALGQKLSKDDIQTFGFEEAMHGLEKNTTQYIAQCSIVVQKYLFKYDVDIEKNKRKLWRLWILDIVVTALFYIFSIWIIFRSDILMTIYNKVANYLDGL